MVEGKKISCVYITAIILLLLGAGGALVRHAEADITCYASNTAGNPFESPINFPGVSYDQLTGWRTYGTIAQLFKTTSDSTVNAIKLKNLSRTGSPGNIILGIMRTSEPYYPYYCPFPLGVPPEGMKTITSPGPSGEWVLFRLDKLVSVTANTFYAIQLQVNYPFNPPAPPAAPVDYWSVQRGFNAYSNGRIVYWTNNGWATMADDASDLLFEVCLDTDAYQTVDTATGSGEMTIVASAGTVETVTPLGEDDLPPNAQTSIPPGVDFPHGLFNITITNLQQGEEVTLSFTFPTDIPVGWVWWYYVEGQGWLSMPVGDDDGDNQITITKTDSGTGDADNTANGTIVDPGGIGPPMQQPPSAVAIPSLTEWGMILFMILAGFGAVVYLRRQRKIEN